VPANERQHIFRRRAARILAGAVFDLVFVVVVAALAGQLHEDHSVLGLAVFAGLFVPVWWCWRSFTWYATGFDSDDPRCRIGLLAGMLGVAVLSIGVAGAAGEGESRTFVLAYVGLLIILGGLYGRIWLLFPAARSLARRYVLGYAVSVVIWSASLALQEGAQPWLWAVAMVVLIATPVAVLRQPRRAYHAAHIAERYGLFTIIVLGESVVVTVSGWTPEPAPMSSRSPCSVLGSRSRSGGRTSAATGTPRAAPPWPASFGRRSMSWSSPGSRPRPSVSSSPSRPRARAAASSWSTGLRSAPALPPTCLRWEPSARRPATWTGSRAGNLSDSAQRVVELCDGGVPILRVHRAGFAEHLRQGERDTGCGVTDVGNPGGDRRLVPSEADRWIELDRQPAHMNAASVPGAVLLGAHHLHDRGAVRRRLAYEGARGRTACGESMSTTDVVHGSTRGWSPECS